MNQETTASPMQGQPAQEVSGQPNADQLAQDHQDMNESGQQEGQGDKIEGEADKTKLQYLLALRNSEKLSSGVAR